MKHLSIIILFLFIASTKANQIISIPILYFKGSFEIQLSIGSSKVCQFKQIDLQFPFLWTTPLYFSESITSKIINSKVFKYDGKEYSTLMYKDKLRLYTNSKEFITLDDFDILLIKDKTIYGEHRDSIGFDIDSNEQSSLVYQLKRNNFIDKLSFAIIPTSNNRGIISFGGLPYNTIPDRKYKTHISITKNKWGASLDTMYIIYPKDSISILQNTISKTPYYYDYNDVAYFQLNKYEISIPSSFMKFLKEKSFFKIFKGMKLCFYTNKEGIEAIDCLYIALRDLPKSIVFVINGKPFKMKFSELFICDRNKCRFQMIHHKNKELFEFGTLFMSKYTTLYDIEDKSITFYSDEAFINKLSISESFTKRFLFIMIFVLSLVSLSLLVIRRKYIKHSINTNHRSSDNFDLMEL